MKKLAIYLSLLLALVLVAAGALPLGLPGEELAPDPARRVDGSLFTAENRDLTSRIYIQKDGQLTGLFRELRWQEGRESYIPRTAAWGDQVYCLRTFRDSRDWQLLALEQGGSFLSSGYRGVPVASGTFDSDMTVTGLTAQDGVIWITGLGSNEAIFVYEVAGEETSLKLIHPAWWLSDVVTARFDGEVIRVTTLQGDHCLIAPTGERTYDESGAEQSAPAVPQGAGPWMTYKMAAFAGALGLWLMAAAVVLVTGWILRRGRTLATRLAALSGGALLLFLAAAVGGNFLLLLRSTGLYAGVDALVPTAIGAGVFWLVTAAGLALLSRRLTRPVKAITRQMEDMADGNVRPRESSPGKDELSQMNRAMQELCMSLSIRDYEMEATVQSYQRFVPQRLTQLLDRANIAEVSLGDSRRFVGDVGLFSVGNRAEVRAVLDDDSFVEFINHSFGVLQSCVQDNGGCMISNGLRLSAMETLFPQNPGDGVRAGLDFLGQTQKAPAGELPAPRSTLILHRAPMLYGVAGQTDRLYPYLSSFELDFLGGFSHRFYQAGARVVATEAYWNALKDSGFSARYIGFVADGDKSAFKLYELLDAYPELERKLRQGYDQRFQEGINLFYHNDFYLARNLFSSLLRVCPEDGIVRWYLFACEHFFNREGDAEVDYSLFGVGQV